MVTRVILNTHAFNSSVDKGSPWAILNATHESAYAFKGPPCIHAHSCILTKRAHTKPMQMTHLKIIY